MGGGFILVETIGALMLMVTMEPKRTATTTTTKPYGRSLPCRAQTIKELLLELCAGNRRRGPSPDVLR
jgi:hypothetical protein